MESKPESDEILTQFEPQARGVLVELKDFAFLQFDQLDANKDGFLSREELLTALYQKDRSRRELAFLNFLLTRLREISASYKEEWADRPDEISRVDLQEYFARLMVESNG